jgi:hypothetical protein
MDQGTDVASEFTRQERQDKLLLFAQVEDRLKSIDFSG